MQWGRIRSKILALHRFDVQPKLKEAGLPSGIFVLPRFALDLALKELSPNAFTVFTLLYSRLDFELRTHWVSGLSIPKIAELLGISKRRVERAIKELREKQYIYVISGRKTPAKAKGIRKHVFGQAKWMGNDYNAYSLLPFFVKLYMELDAQRLEEPESEKPDLPPDEEVLKEAMGDTLSLKPLGDKEKSDDLSQYGKDTLSLKPLGDKEKSDDLSQYGNPFPNIGNPFPNRETPFPIGKQTNETQTKETHIYDTHTNEGRTAEKNLHSQGNPRPAPADGLGELALNLLRAYLSRNENVKSPIAVLKSLTEAQLETLACDALSWFLTYYFSDWELKDEVNKLVEEHGLKCLELLEYVQLSEEEKVEWLKKKGVLNDGND